MWLKRKVRTFEKKVNNPDIKVASDVKTNLKKLKSKVKTLKSSNVKSLKEKEAKSYYAARSMYRSLVTAIKTGKSVAAVEKAKKSTKAPAKTEATEEKKTED